MMKIQLCHHRNKLHFNTEPQPQILIGGVVHLTDKFYAFCDDQNKKNVSVMIQNTQNNQNWSTNYWSQESFIFRSQAQPELYVWLNSKSHTVVQPHVPLRSLWLSEGLPRSL